MKTVLLIGVVVALITFLVACDGGTVSTLAPATETTPEPVFTPEPEAQEDAPDVLQDETDDEPVVENRENNDIDTDNFTGFYQFTTVALGTLMDDALSTLGNPTSTMTVEVMGVESTTKSWWTTNFFRLSTSETVTFTDGYATSVMSTADASSNISADEFSQITTGMSELDVFLILGAPYSVTIMELMGMTSTTVMWINADFSSGTVTFTNDAVSSTMQMNLS
ncbi:MAG: hypothetical protein FWC13_01160 [Oscillospiraceae bacterium]|nr:hypothetical protein [Oscillospiraceae bacterium]